MTQNHENRIRTLAEAKLPPDKLEHSLRVAWLASRQGHTFGVVGLMHDMLEDSDVTIDELLGAGVTGDELTAIELLTRGPETYEEYILQLARSGNRLALSGKLCDLLDHLDPSLIEGLDERKQARYLAALPIVLDALRKTHQYG